MPNPNPALLPSPALFDVTTIAKAPSRARSSASRSITSSSRPTPARTSPTTASSRSPDC